MAFERHPHTATLKYNASGTYSEGIYTPGTESTVEIECNTQPLPQNSYVVGANGDKIPVSWHIFTDLFDEQDSINIGDRIEIDGSDYVIKWYFVYQKHVEIKC